MPGQVPKLRTGKLCSVSSQRSVRLVWEVGERLYQTIKLDYMEVEEFKSFMEKLLSGKPVDGAAQGEESNVEN